MEAGTQAIHITEEIYLLIDLTFYLTIRTTKRPPVGTGAGIKNKNSIINIGQNTHHKKR
jgi:hypothetical protein